MKKRISRVLALLVILSVIMTMVTVTASATNVSNVSKGTLKAGQWTVLKPYSYSYDYSTRYEYWYKLSLPSDGKVTIYGSEYAGDDGFNIEVYNSSKNKCVVTASSSDNSGTFVYALTAGTYYVKSGYSDYHSTKMKYTYTKAANNENCCLARATTLKKNTTVGICSTSRHSYDRWFKVTLTSKQYLHIASKYYNSANTSANTSITVYDKYGEYISTSTMSYGRVTQDKLSKGTYYIKVNDLGSWNRYRGYYVNVKWY